jgi:hypothetical protein
MYIVETFDGGMYSKNEFVGSNLAYLDCLNAVLLQYITYITYTITYVHHFNEPLLYLTLPNSQTLTQLQI